MKFPNVEVQAHWLAVLERAEQELPECLWVCSALVNGVEPDVEEEVRTAIMKAIAPAATVSTWYYLETGSDLWSAHEYRTAWLDHMLDQCRAMQKVIEHKQTIRTKEFVL